MIDHTDPAPTTTEKPDTTKLRRMVGKARKPSGDVHPILFSEAMVVALADGRKSQTRRLLKGMPPAPNPWARNPGDQKHEAPYFDAIRPGGDKTEKNPLGMTDQWCWWQIDDRMCAPIILCPYGKPGDRLWVREAWALVPASAYRCSIDDHGAPIPHRVSPCGQWWAVYRAGWERSAPGRWRPSIHMPRWASRVTLEVTAIRVQRLQDITDEDAIAEGFTSAMAFSAYWVMLHGAGAWNENPWVWVVDFGVVS
jgi:hypothetical protein